MAVRTGFRPGGTRRRPGTAEPAVPGPAGAGLRDAGGPYGEGPVVGGTAGVPGLAVKRARAAVAASAASGAFVEPPWVS
ncbi:hypothetical protein GCM10009654_21700 [Streptomyces hebeiensis]|uniref:Uncharacterized protein n=1 Tax=Streptomyces hebeiensis TaxID=229486 RepID=A0ABN1UTN4_9ACTN